MSSTSELKAKHRRILVAGCRSVGKSSVALQYTESRFDDAYNPTIHNTFKKEITWRGNRYLLHIVDTAGQDEFSAFQDHVGIDGYVLVYNIVNKKSFETVRIINEKILNETANESIPRVMVGNKTDLHGQRKISKEQGEKLAKELGCCAFIETSAKANENIEDIFAKLMSEIEKHQAPVDKRKGCKLM